MAGCAARRLMGERARIQGDDLTARPRPDDLFMWDATLVGPADTPWSGRPLDLEIAFPADYPFKPPSVRFVGTIAHPNVYRDGSVCVDLLGAHWAPACDVRSVLLTLRLLLTEPNPNSPANVSAADAYRQHGMAGLARLNE